MRRVSIGSEAGRNRWHSSSSVLHVCTTGEIGPASFIFFEAGQAWLLSKPIEVVQAQRVAEVWPALQRVEGLVEQGLTAAGYVAFEAAPAFDAAMQVQPANEMPLLWFALYRDAVQISLPNEDASPLEWTSSVGEEVYAAAAEAARRYTAQGDTYQVNLTFPFRAPWLGQPLPHFAARLAAQPSNLAAYIDLGRWQILSFSPELFFELDGSRIITRPMKGTRPRGRWREEDENLAQELAASPKERAENVMIADLLRNDLGRIAEQGSVNTQSLFAVEPYPTVWQLTSTVEAQTQASVPEIFRALFPCGSVTGAPKIRTMDIIRELEWGPRGVYCGAIGVWRPGRNARFNVAIRTVIVDAEQGVATYHTGSGITWDSEPASEWRECLQKTQLLREPAWNFSLLETMRFDGSRIVRMERHLARLAWSAGRFGWRIDVGDITAALAKAVEGQGPTRVRLQLGRDGGTAIMLSTPPEEKRMRVAIHAGPVSSGDLFLYHKTTRRHVYEEALAAHPDCDDVLLQNERGELTESCRANLVVTLNGVDYTPPLHCGLLPGCMRQELLEQGAIKERALLPQDLQAASRVRLVNSLRGWMEVDLVD